MEPSGKVPDLLASFVKLMNTMKSKKNVRLIMTTSMQSEIYWNDYYGSVSAKRIPSQFAAFVLSEFSGCEKFVDFGCGNGRDSFFFAAHGKNVMGVDGASAAVEMCQKSAEFEQINNLTFTQLDLSSALECATFSKVYSTEWSGAVCYARFFLHAITEDAEQNLLQICKDIISSDGSICFEFRTEKDEHLVKETASHYRRYINPVSLIARLNDLGLEVTYFCEGFGFAKYKADDAFVARMVIKKHD